MLAIVRFTDGARLLVREEGLRHFEPVAPTSDAFPDTLFEGAWIRGEAHGLKSNSDSSGLPLLSWLSSDGIRPVSSPQCVSGIPSQQSNGTTFSPPNVAAESSTRAVPKSCPALWKSTDETYPPGHPLNLLRELAQSSATRPLLHNVCERSMRLIDRTPIFLTETNARNALWLSRLSSFANVTVYVERLLPAEATVHWFANRRAAVHSNNPVISKPPPSVVRGEDLANLRPVIPYPYLSCTGSDVWYYQFQDSDVMYNLAPFQCPEELLYDWLTDNQENLSRVRAPFDAPPAINSSTSGTSAARSVGQLTGPTSTAMTQSNVLPNGHIGVKPDKLTKLESDVNDSFKSGPLDLSKDGSSDPFIFLTKTTPFWAQRSLFSSAHRQNRVVVNARRRLNHKELMRWARARERDDEETCTDSSDQDSSESDDEMTSALPQLHQSDTFPLSSTNQASGEKELPTVDASPNASDKWTMNNVLHKCASLITSLGKDHPSGAEAAAGDQGGPTTTVSDSFNSSNPQDSAERNNSRQPRSVSKAMSKTETDAIQLRVSHLPPLRPGSWAPVAIYTTYTTYDVRWQDGTFERDIPCQQLLPVYFNIDEHDFFPGSLVSLKSLVKDGLTQSAELCTTQLAGTGPSSAAVVQGPRNFGVILSANSKDRICLVQWFVPDPNADSSESGRLIPMGPPEEAGVYELVSLVDRQLGYGDVLLMHTPSDPLHADLPAGYLEDIIPETCKLVIRWIDGQTTEVTRSECLFPLDALMDDDDWSDDDSDEFESDDLSTESDSEWSTLSSDVSDATQGEVADDQEAAEIETVVDHESAMRQAAQNVVVAYQRTEAARRLLVDRRSFVFWILRRFVVVPDELDTAVDQLGTLLAAAAAAAPSTPNDQGSGDAMEPDRNNRKTLSSGSDQTSSVDVETGGKLPVAGRLLNPVRAWDYAEEAEAIQVVEKLLSIRELMRSSYQLVHDCRIKRMYTKCNHRELFSEKHVEGVLKSIEISGSTAMQTELSSPTAPDTTNQVKGTPITEADRKAECDSSQLHSVQSLADKYNTLNSEILVAMRRCQMKVLIVPNSTQPFTTSVDNWRDRIHYSLVKSESDDETVTVYMLVSSSLFDQLTRYLTMVHNRLLDQLTDFEACALAWLGECAPDLVTKAKSLSVNDEDLQLDVGSTATGDTAVAHESEVISGTESSSTDPTAKPATSEATQPSASGLKSQDIPNPTTTDFVGTRNCSIPSVDEIPAQFRGQFIMEENAPSTHRFYRSQPDSLPKQFYKAWKRDNTLLSTSLPRGIIVKAFEDRLDLYSLMIVGPAGTPYEHGLFLFDVQLPARYPSVPPQVHYYAFGTERVNPNLYVKGHVCLSLLGTWAGEDSENWSAENSNLLQLVVSLQGLILNSEPYFNEAGFEACRGNPEAHERSRVYNESVVATLVQSMVHLLQNLEPVFRKEIVQHCITKANAYAELLDFWASLDDTEFNRLRTLQSSSISDTPATQKLLPEFPLAPVSKGFQVSVRRHRLTFLQLVEALKCNDLG
ncbi:Ubiquitin-conjugating enzyme E2 O [Fasciola hepatica]|uniref:Ubiquitin-conjugating enzyme E2 O n=1 Tax=Fasciola hepatica TaxID=6192 RepID=A0A4E0RAY1_FASHE|nr:Ubiquitin-conjugating enzyme E2 O [Fasciola hepatica]